MKNTLVFAAILFIASPSYATTNPIFQLNDTSTAVNEVVVTGAATGNAPTIVSSGTDTNVGLTISTQGTGALNLETAGSGNIILAPGSGNVGIGTSSPGATLEVNGSLTVDNSGNGLTVSGSVSNNSVGFIINNTSGHEWIIGSQGSSSGTPNSFEWYDNTSGGTRMLIDGNGKVLVGFSSSQSSCCLAQINGTIGATSTSITSLSDARLKKNIVPLEDGLSVIGKLRPVTFEYLSGVKTPTGNKEPYNFPKGEQIGFIYQDVAHVVADKNYRNAVVTDPENGGYGMLQEGNLVPILVKSIQELQAENTELKAMALKQQNRIDEFEQKLERSSK